MSTICPPFRASLEVSERCGNLPIKRTGSGRKWKGNIRERELAVVVILTLDQVPSTVWCGGAAPRLSPWIMLP